MRGLMANAVVGYFCMEYGLHESFPIYSGGLGILAGDFMKSAGDLGLPVVGVGLRWERGYSTQRIGPDGSPTNEFPVYVPPPLHDTGVRVRVRVKGRAVECAVFQDGQFSRAPLYLLEPTAREDRWITRRLYDTAPDARIAQEMLLGIGGVRALDWLGLDVKAYHFNEGHAVFAGVEFIASAMAAGHTFREARELARKRVVFTTHTPVPAGNEVHDLGHLRRLGACCELSDIEMTALGGSPFSMTVAGLRLAGRANAVSQLHAETARAMWSNIHDGASLVAVTNGVHAPTWQDARIRSAYPDGAQLWEVHQTLKRELGELIQARTGAAPDPTMLWIGHARRAAGYKRNDLLLRDPVRLKELLEAGVRLVFAGKAHPDDPAGARMVTTLAQAARSHPGQIFFLENYDMEVGRAMTRGCDVWLNTPLRPLEASGTSGMKAAMNGALHLSVLDGWWPEVCRHGVNGWGLGGGSEGGDADTRDLAALQKVIREEVLPAFRDRGRWVEMMKQSVADTQERFSSHRMALEYFEKLYEWPIAAGAPKA
jgi:starch phosphorylase